MAKENSNPMFPDLDGIVEELMTLNGWNIDDNPIEFDKNRDDSQISLFQEEVVQILKVIEKHYKVEPIECLECGGKDILVTVHTCTMDLAIQSED